MGLLPSQKLKEFSTTDLVDELKNRQGIQFIHCGTPDYMCVEKWNKEEMPVDISTFNGPVSLVVIRKWE